MYTPESMKKERTASTKIAQQERLAITLTYSGPDVEDGSMSPDDLVPVLEAFAGAYGKIGAASGKTVQHRFRLAAIQSGSASLLLDVSDTTTKNAATLQAVGQVVSAAMAILGTLITVIKIKKHTKGEPHSTKLDGNTGGISIFNSQNVEITVNPSDYAAFTEKMIDADLSRIARPLETGRIDSSQLTATDGKKPLSETIAASEKWLFDVVEANNDEGNLDPSDKQPDDKDS